VINLQESHHWALSEETKPSISVDLPAEPISLKEFTKKGRKAYAKYVLLKVKGDRSLAAAILGIDIRTPRRVLNPRQKDSAD